MRYAIINKQTRVVVNVVEWEGDMETWQPPEGHDAIASDTANIGDTHSHKGGGSFTGPAPEPQPVARVVTMRQARLALLAAGKLTAVNDAVRGIPGAEGDAARVEWEFAATVDRDSAMVGMLASALRLTTADLDALFATAAGL